MQQGTVSLRDRWVRESRSTVQHTYAASLAVASNLFLNVCILLELVLQTVHHTV